MVSETLYYFVPNMKQNKKRHISRSHLIGKALGKTDATINGCFSDGPSYSDKTKETVRKLDRHIDDVILPEIVDRLKAIIDPSRGYEAADWEYISPAVPTTDGELATVKWGFKVNANAQAITASEIEVKSVLVGQGKKQTYCEPGEWNFTLEVAQYTYILGHLQKPVYPREITIYESQKTIIIRF